MNKFGFFCLLSLVAMMAIVLGSPTDQRVWAWAAVALCMLVFIACLGVTVSGRPLGILVNEQNLMSISRFQAVLWTVIILSALLVIASARLRDGVAAPLNVRFSGQVLTLLGISSAALVGSPLIDATKKSKTPAPDVAAQTASAMAATNNVPASVVAQTQKAAPTDAGVPPDALAAQTAALTVAIDQNAQGLLYKNPKVSDASFSDLFEGSEVGDAAHINLAKVQMFFSR